MIYRLPFTALESGAVVDTYLTLLGLKAAATAGHRARLKELHLGGSGVDPQDLQVTVRCSVMDQSTDGTSTDASGDVVADPGAVASRMSAIGKQFTVEPTAVARTVYYGAFHTRGLCYQRFDGEDANNTQWGPSETMCLQVTIGSGTTEAELSGELVWEEF